LPMVDVVKREDFSPLAAASHTHIQAGGSNYIAASPRKKGQVVMWGSGVM